ncbi:MAG: hypothetical protein HND44_24800 [Chloroflexi bacterium]|nr:hypothetical protein [Ardenticatenaceae bacterium]MBL1131637.1 hypothetical protein [Chloroflexota bacterium]NOG37754.1 hypothetical protein [Chloroflexota bacterium]
MSVNAILAAVQFVVDQQGQQTAVLLDLQTWDSLRYLLEELAEDERFGQLMLAVAGDEKFVRETAWQEYQAYLTDSEP